MNVRLLISENQKMISNKWILLTIAALLVSIPAMVYFLGAQPGTASLEAFVSKLRQSFYLGQAWFVALASLYVGQEFQKSTVRTSLLASPKRLTFLASKTICLLAWIVVLLLVATLLSLLIIQFGFAKNMTPEQFVILLRSLIPAYLATIELTLITMVVVILSQSMVVSMGIFVSMLLGLAQLLMQYIPAMRYFPVLATMNSFLFTSSVMYMSEYQGLLCQGLWLIVIGVVTCVVFRRRAVK